MSTTQTTTFTATDIRKVVDSFAADYWMVVQATGLHTEEDVDRTVSDLKLFAENSFLVRVVLMLSDSNGKTVKGRSYEVSNQAIGWANDSPGGNMWPRLAGGSLKVIATLSTTWGALNEEEKKQKKAKMGIFFAWGLTNADTSFSGMTAAIDKRYSSNGYGLQRTTFE